jgi:hypothetical protein
LKTDIFQSLLPPSEKGRKFERAATMLRQFVGAKPDQPLNPFRIAGLFKILVVDIDKIVRLPDEVRRQLQIDSRAWSAGTTRPMPDGWRLVIMNPASGKERNRATLMEEICHVWLKHKPGRLHAQENGGIRARDYNQADEQAAYGVGAAALVPYSILVMAVENGVPSEDIARQYHVSRDLVEFRIKVTHLWPEYRRKVLQSD